MKLMLFGDSHIAALKKAATQMEIPEHIDLTFWGTAAAVFRRLCWRDGAIHASDAEAERYFAAYSKGLTKVDPKEYDAVVFVSTRIRLGHILPNILEVTTDPTRHITRKYLKKVIEERFEAFLTFPFAKNIGQMGSPKIWLSLSPLDTDGRVAVMPYHQKAGLAEHHHVLEVWDLIEEVLGEHNIGFIPQPVETIVNGYFTDDKHGVEARRDYLHKNEDYGKMMLSQTLDIVSERMAE